MNQLLRSAVTAAIIALGPLPCAAQGVPTIDGSSLAQLLKQIEHMSKDMTVQLEQLATMKTELETQIAQLTNLEGQLAALLDAAGLGDLLATAEDFLALRGSIEQPMAALEQLKRGNFSGAFREGSASASRAQSVLGKAGFSADMLSGLSSSDKGADKNLATQAGASAMLSVAAEEAHEEAGNSLERIETLTGHINKQKGVRAAVDLNTRVTAELGIILTQIWRLEAAQGVSAGQLGVVDAATLAAERKFRTMEVPK